MSKKAAQGTEVSLGNRCHTCLMPAHAVTMASDGGGCTYCSPKDERKNVNVGEDFIPNNNKGWTIEDIRNLRNSSSGPYDCLIGITGGRDSSFILYFVTKILKLRPLAVNFSTPFQTEEARHNMREVTSKLGIDFISYSIASNFFQKLAKGFFVKYGEFCSPCHKGHHYTLAKFAMENGIKVIIRGISSKVDLNRMNPKYFNYFCQSEDEFNARVGAIAHEFHITDKELHDYRKMTHLAAWKDKEVLTIDLPDLLQWQYSDIQGVLDREFDLKYPQGQFFHCDCQLNPTLCYQEYCKHGYSEKQIVISNLLASRDITLDHGKKLLLDEEMPDVPPNIAAVLECIGVDRQTFDEVIDKFWRKAPAASKQATSYAGEHLNHQASFEESSRP